MSSEVIALTSGIANCLRQSEAKYPKNVRIVVTENGEEIRITAAGDGRIYNQ